MFRGRIDEWCEDSKKKKRKEKVGRMTYYKAPSCYCFSGIEVVSADSARGEVRGIDRETGLGETRTRA